MAAEQQSSVTQTNESKVEKLKSDPNFESPDGPVVLVIADGVGVAPAGESNAVTEANTPTIDSFADSQLYRELKAHGTFVGLPSDSDIGNSEVGHNAMGAGRIFDQGAKLVNGAIESGELFASDNWKEVIGSATRSTLHFLGLHSDGRVHSDITHLHAFVRNAYDSGVDRVRLHLLFDGRDTPERSAKEYLDQTQALLDEIDARAASDGRTISYLIASGGGRMTITMDRYEADWPMVQRGFECHVHGIGRRFASAHEALETFYSESDDGDQNLGEFVVVEDDEPVGKMSDGDVVVLFNFRGDRAIEISRALEESEFSEFDRGEMPDVSYYGLLEYDGDLKIPSKYLVEPPAIDRTMSEFVCELGLKSFAVSETQKFGHVTYFWNGNSSGYVDESLESYVEIPSDNIDPSLAPAMKASEITDAAIEMVKSGEYSFGRINYPNGDMVGHTGDLDATISSMEHLDIELRRLTEAVHAAGGVVVFTADHGNADVMFKEVDGNRSPVTSHTVNPAPFAISDHRDGLRYQLVKGDGTEDMGLANVASTIFNLLGYEAPSDYEPSLIQPVVN